MEEKKWYQSWGYWTLINLGLLTTFGILDNWFDWAGVAGGFMLAWITIPYIIVMAVVGTIRKLNGKGGNN